jgi:hypothetical protein
MNAVTKPKIKPSNAIHRQHDEAAMASAILSKMGLTIHSISVTAEQVIIVLKNDSFHPKLKGVWCGIHVDSNGNWNRYEYKINDVLVRWSVNKNRRYFHVSQN